MFHILLIIGFIAFLVFSCIKKIKHDEIRRQNQHDNNMNSQLANKYFYPFREIVRDNPELLNNAIITKAYNNHTTSLSDNEVITAYNTAVGLLKEIEDKIKK